MWILFILLCRWTKLPVNRYYNAILIGSPGSGKSSLAKAMAGILPPMSLEESLQTSKIYSVAGKGNITAPHWQL